LRLDGTNAEIRVEAGDASPALAAAPTNLASFLRATPALQSEHPDLVAKAREITAASRTPEEKARAIGDWVYRNVAKQTTISLPSALDVLKTLAGDCNEHTYLFAALARAAGLPSRIHAGLAYHEGAFYYHAWPDVWTGRWLEMDPTWGQPAVDATHISLAEGELGSQLQLVKVLGRLKIEVLEER
jgi:transglutaminase-like putative cysteine protease